MTTWQLRTEFKNRFKQRFGYDYPDTRRGQELKLLKTLVFNYGSDVVYLAIGYFFQSITHNKSELCLFASSKYFAAEFEKIIRNKDVAWYIVNINLFLENRNRVEELLDEYTDYAEAWILADDEIVRKREILVELEKIKEGLNCAPKKLS